MAVSTVSQSFATVNSKGYFDDILDTDMSIDFIDAEGICESVFSSPFDENDDLTFKVCKTNFGLQLTLPEQTQMTVQQAVPVSPNASSIELSSCSFDLRPTHSLNRSGKQDDESLYEPMPLAEMMAAHSEQTPKTVLSTGVSLQAKKKRAAPASKTKPAKKQRSNTQNYKGNEIHDENSSEDVMEQTRLRNRDHARKSRMRKKILTENLQHTFDALKEENEKLRKMIMQAFGPSKTEAMIQERSGSQQPVEQFIEALKTPENRVVDGKGLAFLTGLRKDAIAASSASSRPKKQEKMQGFPASCLVVG